jgi:flagella basal body P-ring formation protein FlgA
VEEGSKNKKSRRRALPSRPGRRRGMIEQSSPFLPIAGLAGALMLCGSVACASGLELPVPSVTIYPGDVIGDSLLVDKTFSLRPGQDNLPVHKSRDELIGKVAKRTLLPGKPIPLNSTREVETVRQGKPVAIVFQAGGLTITGQAIPLQSGRAGDLLSLRNMDSGATIKGIVQADGTVRVSGP